jgi:hypothetical protein
MVERVLVHQTVEMRFQVAGHLVRATGARAILQALWPLMGKALHPLAHSGMRKVEGCRDGVDVWTRNHLPDGLRAAKDARLLGLLAYSLSGRHRMIGKGAFERAHRLLLAG